jgi:hypothetical protein
VPLSVCEKSNGLTLTLMNSKWLCADSDEARKARDVKQVKPSASFGVHRCFLGVFTDDPANIGRMLPRPKTPFFPVPTVSIAEKDLSCYDDAKEPDVECDSPPSALPYDFGRPALAQCTGAELSLF